VALHDGKGSLAIGGLPPGLFVFELNVGAQRYSRAFAIHRQ
jgi:hypothetical protein